MYFYQLEENEKDFTGGITQKGPIHQQLLSNHGLIKYKQTPITDKLNLVITKYIKKYPKIFKIVELSENVGLGKALCEGIKHCKYDLIARMDADDYSFPDRICKELEYLNKYPSLFDGT